MTVQNAVAIAGGFTPRAERDVATVTRLVRGQLLSATVPITYPVRPATPSPSRNGGSDMAAPPAGGPPLRILHVFRAPVGGLFRHVIDLAGAQAQAGHSVGIVCDVGGGERADAALAALAPRLQLGVTRMAMQRARGRGISRSCSSSAR